jgi:hypothetical protein
MFHWRLLLKISAQLLSGVKATEADIRSSINRAYYAASGEAREFALAHGYAHTGSGSLHQRVWHFLQRGTPTLPHWEAGAWKAIGDAGLALMTGRVSADYDADASVTMSDAQHAVAAATQIVARLHGLP